MLLMVIRFTRINKVSNNTDCPIIFILIEKFVLVSRSAMPTYQPSAAPTANWLSTTIAPSTITYSFSAMAMSDDGNYVTVGTYNNQGIFSRQSSSGSFIHHELYSNLSTNAYFSSISMSLNGQYQIALNEQNLVYVSNDYGVTWTNTSDGLPASFDSSLGWKFSAMSDNGFIIFLAQSNGQLALYRANPYVDVWQPSFVSLPQIYVFEALMGIAMDGTGQTFAYWPRYDMLYLSHNYGYSWIQKLSIPETYLNTYNVFTMSRNTKSKVVVVSVNKKNILYITYNHGVTWNRVQGPGAPTNYWVSLSCSGTGQYISGILSGSAISENGVYLSSDYGQTWTMIYSIQSEIVSINSAGNYLISVSSISNDLYYYEHSGTII